MYVVLVTNKLVNGGGERVLAQLVSGVRAGGGRISILFLGTRRAIVPSIRAEMEASGAQVVLLSSPFAALRVLRAATALHLFSVNVYVKALPILPLFLRKPVICHVHGSAESANPLARLLFSAGWNLCDEIVFVSQAGRASWGMARGRVVANPVTFPPRSVSTLSAPTGQLRLFSVNRLVTVKRVAAQLDILASLRRNHGYDATLDIVGEGPELVTLEAKASALGLGNTVHFLGGCAHEEVLDLYSEYDGFLATSAAEGLGLSLIEALAAGLPAFAAPIPAFREVAGVGGGVSFIDPDAPEKAAAVIASTMSTSPLPTADREKISAAFNSECFVAQMLDLYSL